MSDEISLTPEQLFTRIVTGQAVIPMKDNLLIVRDPTVYEKQMAEIVYDTEVNKLVTLGVPTRQSLLEKLEESNMWSKADSFREESIPEEISRIKEELKKCEYRSITKSALLRKQERLISEMNALYSKKEGVLRFGAESLANNLRHKYFVYRLTYDTNMKPYFSRESFESFLQHNDEESNIIMNSGFYPKNVSEADIRKLARSEPWRSVWVAAQKTGNLFGKPMIEITDLQRMLIAWSLIYDSAMESSECPDQSVFDDDLQFDNWLSSRSSRSSNKTTNHDPKFIGKADRMEVGIVVESEEDARKVYAMNSPESIKVVKEREQVSKQKGQTKEGDMPDSQKIVRQKLVALQSDRFK